MKAKDWIRELQKLDTETEVYVWYSPTESFRILTPQASKKELIKYVSYTIPFYYEATERRRGTPVGKHNILELRPW